MPERINFDDILECMENGVCIVDTGLKVVYQDDKHRSIKGDCAGEVCFKAFHGRETRCEGCPAVTTLSDGDSHKSERLRVVEGTERYFKTVSSPIRNRAGEVIAVINITTETTGRSHTVSSIERAMRDWEDTFDTIDDIITLHDRDYNIIRANRAAREALGITEDQYGTVKCYEAYHGTGSVPDGCPSCNLVKKGQVVTIERFEPHLNMFVEIKAMPRFNGGDEPRGCLHIVRDITERKQMEEALRKSEETFSGLFNSDLIGVTVVDKDTNILRANRTYQKMIGYTEEELRGLKLKDVSHSDEIEKNLRFFREMVDGKRKTFLMEKKYVRKNGSTFWGDLEVAGVYDEEGIFKYCVAIVRDITERKQMEDALKDSEEIHRTLFRDASDAILIADMETGIILDANDRVETLLGYTRDEIVGMDRKYLHPDEKTDEYTRNFKKGSPGQGMISKKILLRRKDGSVVPAEISAAVTELMGKKVRIGIFRDMTERLQAEEALQKSEENLARAQEIAKIGSWEWDIPSNEIALSREVYSIYGIDPGEKPQYQVIIDTLHPEYKNPFVKAIYDALKRNKPFEGEYRIIRPDGTERTIYTKGEVTFDENGKPIRMFGVMQDVTERKQMENELRETIAEKEMLIKEVHHRVKNNLSVIQSLLRLQAGQIADGKTKELFVESQNRIRSMSMIHERLHRAQDITSLDFSEYVNSLVKKLFRSYMTDSSKIRLVTDLQEANIDVDTMIPCGLIINELMSNIFKHAFPGDMTGEVVVKFKVTGKGEYELTVKDNGVGLPQDIDIENTGTLGMQIITSLTSQVNGRLAVVRDEGTEFRISFKDKSFIDQIDS